MTVAKLPRFILLIIALAWCAIPGTSAAQTSNPQPTMPDLCKVAKTLQEDELLKVCGDIKYLGLGTFTGLGLIPSGLDIRASINKTAVGRDELVDSRHFFAYDVFVILVSKNDTTQDWDMVLRTASAINVLKSAHRNAYLFINSTLRYPTAPALPTSAWKNRNGKIFISFDKTPDSIAASGTLLGRCTKAKGVDMCDNYAIISIDEESILGKSAQIGSRRIYNRPVAEDNYRVHMADGLLFSLVHEAVHLSITHLNSTNLLANAIYSSRGKSTDAEEIIANETAMELIENALRPEMIQFVMDENTDLVAKSGVRKWLSVWKALPGRSRGLLVVAD